MAIRWSAVKVSEAMDQVEQQLNLADAFLADAEARAKEADRFPGLPQYITERTGRLQQVIEEGRNRMGNAVRRVREGIPEGAVEAERQRGKQHELML